VVVRQATVILVVAPELPVQRRCLVHDRVVPVLLASGRPEPGRRAPLLEACPFDNDTDGGAFNRRVGSTYSVSVRRRSARSMFGRLADEWNARQAAPCPLDKSPAAATISPVPGQARHIRTRQAVSDSGR
jgi:hypothetical protein